MSNSMTELHISTGFDSGTVEVVSVRDHRNIQLNIRPDNASDFAQWFHFALHGASGLSVTLRFLNAGACAYPKGWEDYQVVASHDRQNWFRIDTQFDGQVMTARVTPARSPSVNGGVQTVLSSIQNKLLLAPSTT